MRKFVIIKDGIARIMEAQDSVTDPMDEIKKWHPDDQAKVTSVREISENDIPVNRTVALRDAWEDDGSKINVNLNGNFLDFLEWQLRRPSAMVRFRGGGSLLCCGG